MNAFCGGLVGNTSLCSAQFVLLNGNIKQSKVLSNMAKYADLDSVHVLGVGCGCTGAPRRNADMRIS